MSDKRILIVDVNHIAFAQAFGGFTLTSKINGQTVDTSIPNGVLKNVMRWSKNGKYPTVLCFDRACRPRKWYFDNFNQLSATPEVKKYKANREKMPSKMFTSIGLTENLLRQAGVTCLAAEGYEADDLIYAAIESAKKHYPGTPIDVVTGDSDLIPLVDDVVSVFLRSRKGTWAESKHIEKNKYIQVTPSNYRDVVKGLSSFKDYDIPYNLLLLLKITRGDESDNVLGWKKKFPPRVVKEMLKRLEAAGFTGLSYGQKLPSKSDPLGSPEPIQNLIRVLRETCSDLVDEDGLKHIYRTYIGINLNQAFIDYKNKQWVRKPIAVQKFEGFSPNALISAGKQIGINIRIS